jgi:hypothetical protein
MASSATAATPRLTSMTARRPGRVRINGTLHRVRTKQDEIMCSDSDCKEWQPKRPTTHTIGTSQHSELLKYKAAGYSHPTKLKTQTSTAGKPAYPSRPIPHRDCLTHPPLSIGDLLHTNPPDKHASTSLTRPSVLRTMYPDTPKRTLLSGATDWFLRKPSPYSATAATPR